MTLAKFPPNDYGEVPSIPFREPGRAPQNVLRPSAKPIAADRQFPASFRLLNDTQLMDLPDPRWIVDGLIPESGLTVVWGLPGSCKTIGVASLTVAIATGRNWFGHQVKNRGASIYVAAEDTSGWKVRLRAAKRAADAPLTHSLDIFTFPDGVQLLDDASVERFIRFVQAEGEGQPWLKTLRCVVIDTYAASTVGGNENSSEDTTKALANARRIMKELQCAAILVHHANASGNRERGHSALRGDADAMFMFKEEDTTILVESEKVKNGAPFKSLELRLDTTTYGGPVLKHSADLPPGPELSDNQRRALRALCETFGADGATKTEWQNACANIAQATFYRATKALIEERGYAVKQGNSFKATPAGRKALGL